VVIRRHLPICRSQWPRGPRPLVCWDCGLESCRGAWIVSYECCVLSGRGRSLRWVDSSSRGVLVCLSVIRCNNHPLHLQWVGRRGINLMYAIPLCDIIKHIQIFTSIHNNYCLTQLYFARGDMFRLLIQPSSGQLTLEQDLLCGHNMGYQTVYI